MWSPEKGLGKRHEEEEASQLQAQAVTGAGEGPAGDLLQQRLGAGRSQKTAGTCSPLGPGELLGKKDVVEHTNPDTFPTTHGQQPRPGRGALPCPFHGTYCQDSDASVQTPIALRDTVS